MDHLVEELREKQVQKAIKKDKALNLRKARGQKFRGGRGMEESAGAASAAAEVHVPSEDLLEIIDLREEARRKKAMEETRKAAKIEDSNQVEKQTTITTDDSCGGGSGKTKLDTKPQVAQIEAADRHDNTSDDIAVRTKELEDRVKVLSKEKDELARELRDVKEKSEQDLATATQAKEASEAAVLSGETALQILDQLKSLPLIVEKLQALEPSIKDRTRAAGQSAEEASSSSSDSETSTGESLTSDFESVVKVVVDLSFA